MNILVTGGGGFIGTNLCLQLLKLGHHVYVIDNLITGSKDNINKLAEFPNFEFIKHDITKRLPKKLLSKHLQFSAIYDLACPTGVPNLVPLAEEMLLTCSIGTLNLLKLAKEHKAVFLLTSSSESYGDPLVSPQPETYTGNVDPVGMRSPYEEGKRFAEALTIMFARKYRLNAKIVRIFNTYGPFSAKNETRVIPKLLRQALSNKPLTIHAWGGQKRTFCYVDDLVSGLQLVMHKGKPGEVYNLGSETQTTIQELAKLIINITRSKSKIISVERPLHDHQSRFPDLTKVKRLGWKPHISLPNGLKLTSASIQL